MPDLTPTAGRQLAERLATRLARLPGTVTLTDGGTIIHQPPKERATLNPQEGDTR